MVKSLLITTFPFIETSPNTNNLWLIDTSPPTNNLLLNDTSVVEMIPPETVTKSAK